MKKVIDEWLRIRRKMAKMLKNWKNQPDVKKIVRTRNRNIKQKNEKCLQNKISSNHTG